MSEGQRDLNKTAVDGLAADMVQRAEPALVPLLEREAQKAGVLKPGERMNSETAHRLAAQTARDADARRRR